MQPAHKFNYLTYKNQILALAEEKGFHIDRLKPYADLPELETILIYNQALKESTSAGLHISATHGSEGPIGAEIQIQLLKLKGVEWQNSSVGFLMIFALNPFGFHYLRRSSIENIDLNRNVGDGLPLIPSKWEHRWIRPLWRSHNLKNQIQGWAQVIPLSFKIGFSSLARIYAEGQNLEPQGIFYSGEKQAIEIKTLFQHLKPLLNNKKFISILDAHTGLGKLYDETLFHCSGDTDLSRNPFSHSIEIPGEKKNSYRGFGLLSDRFENEFPNAKVHFVVQELGVKSSAQSFITLMLENQYHWTHFKKVSDKIYLQHPIKQLLFSTFFSTNPEWIEWARRTGSQRFTELFHSI